MNIKDIPEMLKKFVFDYVETVHNQKREKLILFEKAGSYYLIYFVIIKKIPFNNEIYNGSHENLIMYLFESFIERVLLNDRKKMELRFNLDEEYSCLIDVFYEKLNDDSILFPEERTGDKLKQKIYDIIENEKKSISLGELIQKTRFTNIKMRNECLEKLIIDKKIELTIDKSQGRQKKLYRAI